MKNKFVYLSSIITLSSSIAIWMVSAMFMAIACTPTEQRDSTLNVSLNGNPETLDPHLTSATLTFQVLKSVYDTLLESDGGFLLAKEYSSTMDSKEWLFVLHDDRVFHHGKKLDAQDVKASFDRLISLGAESPHYQRIASIQEIEVVGTHQVKFIFSEPFLDVIELFGSSFATIMPRDLIENEHNFSLQPVGTGPYVLKNWNANFDIQLVAFNEYLPSPPPIANLTFVIIEDLTKQMQLLINNELDYANYIIEPELSILEKDPNVIIEVVPGSSLAVLAFNLRKDELKNRETRIFLAQSIHKQTIIGTAYGQGVEVDVFWHPNNAFYTDRRGIYDPEAARAYFQKNPIRRRLSIVVPKNYVQHVRAAQLYQQMLSDVGVQTEIVQVDFATWLNKVYGPPHDFDMTVIAHTGLLDPIQRLSLYGRGQGYVGWVNDSYSTILEEIQHKVQNRNVKVKKVQEALMLMSQDYPFVFIGVLNSIIARNVRLEGVRVDPVLVTYDFRYASFKD